MQNNNCPFGDKCNFHHDVAEYLATKPADIGESCYLYDTFGKCSYGLSCRFAKAHTTPDFKTMENAELIKAYEGRTTVKNSLSKDLQNRLRKRSVDFKKSAEYLKTLSNNRDKQQGNGKTTPPLFLLLLKRGDVGLVMSLLSGLKLYRQKCSNQQRKGSVSEVSLCGTYWHFSFNQLNFS